MKPGATRLLDSAAAAPEAGPVPGLLDLLKRWRCCPPPPQVTGVVAQPGGGSGEVFLGWDPLPAAADVAHYRVYRRVQAGVWRPIAAVTPDAEDPALPGKVVLLEIPGAFPPAQPDVGPAGARTYAVSAVGGSGLEGPWSVPVTGTPP